MEGYTESLGTGLMAGINLARQLQGQPIAVPPPTTMLGGLYRYLREADPKHFQPMNANFGLLDPLPGKDAERRIARRSCWSSGRRRTLAAWLRWSRLILETENSPQRHRGHRGLL